MGIRYYAYAFDPQLTRRAVENPRSIVSGDPLADAWGMTPHTAVGIATFQQTTPERDLLYLDKAWSALQALTLPAADEPRGTTAYRMFEGSVTPTEYGWEPWIRTILPDEVAGIRDDLRSIDDDRVLAWARTWRHPYEGDEDEELSYVRQFLDRAREFVERLARDGRGMVYMIG